MAGVIGLSVGTAFAILLRPGTIAATLDAFAILLRSGTIAANPDDAFATFSRWPTRATFLASIASSSALRSAISVAICVALIEASATNPAGPAGGTNIQ